MAATNADAGSKKGTKNATGSKKGTKAVPSNKNAPKNVAVSAKGTAKAPPPQNKQKATRIPLHTRIGLDFPVARITKYLRKGRYAPRVGRGASVFATGVISYMVSELLQIAAEMAQKMQKQRVKPRHLQLAIREDVDFAALLEGVVISDGGVPPSAILEMPIKKKKTNTKAQSAPKKGKAVSKDSAAKLADNKSDESRESDEEMGADGYESGSDQYDEDSQEYGADI